MTGFIQVPCEVVPNLERLAVMTDTAPTEYISQSFTVATRLGRFAAEVQESGIGETPELVIRSLAGQNQTDQIVFIEQSPREPTIDDMLAELEAGEGFTVFPLDEELVDDGCEVSRALGVKALELIRHGMLWRLMLDRPLRRADHLAAVTAGSHVVVPIHDVQEFVGYTPPELKLPDIYLDPNLFLD